MRRIFKVLAPMLAVILPLSALLPLPATAVPAHAAQAAVEDGYDLWLRYRPLDKAARMQLRPVASTIVILAQPPHA
eukprot:gene35632-43936_t